MLCSHNVPTHDVPTRSLVAEGRGLTAETVEEIAQGKVYVADEALKIGLIDRIGGFNEALAECRKAAAALRRAKATTKAAPAPAAAPVAAPAAAADVPPAAGRSLAVDAEEDCDASHENTVLVPFPVQSLWQLLSGNRPRNSRANPSPSLSAAVAAAPAVVASAAAAAALGPRRAALLRRVDGVVRAATDDGAVGAALGAVEAACTAQGVAVASLDESFHGTV